MADDGFIELVRWAPRREPVLPRRAQTRSSCAQRVCVAPVAPM